MKKTNKETGKNLYEAKLTICTTVDEAPLLRNLVEKLAHRRIDLGYSRETVPTGWKAIETSSLEAFVSGDLSIACETEGFKIPYTSCFLFTCTKASTKEFTLSWINSLS
jgi:hypothetical protein